MQLLWQFVIVILSLAQISASAASKTHGMAMRAEVKYKAGFKNFDYVNPTAPKGGTLTLGSAGTFDTFNPFLPKGSAPSIIAPPTSTALAFESLLSHSYDEPFSEYGLLAESFELAADELSVIFYLNPLAKFSDGKAVAAADVVFSYNLLTSDIASPFYKSYYADVKNIIAKDNHTVQFNFLRKNAELHLVLGQMPIIPEHFYEKGNFSADYTKTYLSSGPYVLKDYEFGKFLKLERNPSYWGYKIPVNVGKFNYNSIYIKYFKDSNVMFEAFKAGEFDTMPIVSSKQWAVDCVGDKFDKNWIIKRLIKHDKTEGIQGFVLNTRRKQLQNRDVRHALALALDFDWMNKTLFYSQYKASTSYFDNSELQATGLPTAEELKLLVPLKKELAPEVFTEPMGAPLGSKLDSRGRLLAAKKLFELAGYSIKDGVLTNAVGEKLSIEIMLEDPTSQRFTEPYVSTLKKLGVAASFKMEDKSIFLNKVRKFEFDALNNKYGQSESPGNEQRNMWHSSTANAEDSDNYAGIKNPAIDSLVETLIAAKSRAELVTATHALSRALWYEYYMVPQWYLGANRALWWNKFGLPQHYPSFILPTSWLMYFGWIDPKAESALAQAKNQGSNLPDFK